MYGVVAIPVGSPICFSYYKRSSSLRLRRRLRFAASVQTFTAEPSTAVDSSRRNRVVSLYEILRVEHTASPTEIKSAYRSLAKMYHPDHRAESDGRDFIEIHNAYETLSDPAARAMYDLSLGAAHVNRRRRYGGSRPGFYPTRRWETDQCW